jgi:hypothetical protein
VSAEIHVGLTTEEEEDSTTRIGTIVNDGGGTMDGEGNEAMAAEGDGAILLWPVKVTLLWPMKEMVLWTVVMKMVPGIALDTLSFDLINANLFDCAFI